jgi:hypothetical protein
MRRATFALALLALLSCAPGAVRLERYRGAYSTHFDDIPDQSEICAIVRNASARPVEWIELRLESSSRLAATPGEWRSSWIHRGRIEPGERVALRFQNPPVADELEVRIARVGRDPRAPLNGRPLVRSEACSDEALRATLDAGLAGREATNARVRSAARRSDDAPEALVAGP